jgi:hypothetical protein
VRQSIPAYIRHGNVFSNAVKSRKVVAHVRRGG